MRLPQPDRCARQHIPLREYARPCDISGSASRKTQTDARFHKFSALFIEHCMTFSCHATYKSRLSRPLSARGTTRRTACRPFCAEREFSFQKGRGECVFSSCCCRLLRAPAWPPHKVCQPWI